MRYFTVTSEILNLLVNTQLLSSVSSDSIESAWQILDQIPGRATGAYSHSQPKELVGIIVLLNQLICKFSVAVHDILDDVFPAIAKAVFAVVPRDAFPTGPGTNTEEIRERQELQRTFYTFLNVIATHDLSSVFLSPKSRAYLDPIMQLLLYSCCNHKDITVRKACVQIFIRLIKDWSTGLFGEEKTFVVETFATNCCLYSVLDKSFDFQDANTLALFGEIITAQTVMYEKFGENFVAQFVSTALQI